MRSLRQWISAHQELVVMLVGSLVIGLLVTVIGGVLVDRIDSGVDQDRPLPGDAEFAVYATHLRGAPRSFGATEQYAGTITLNTADGFISVITPLQNIDTRQPASVRAIGVRLVSYKQAWSWACCPGRGGHLIDDNVLEFDVDLSTAMKSYVASRVGSEKSPRFSLDPQEPQSIGLLIRFREPGIYKLKTYVEVRYGKRSTTLVEELGTYEVMVLPPPVFR